MKKVLALISIFLTMGSAALAAENMPAVDTIAGGAKLTKADAARQSGPRDGRHRILDAASGDAAAQAQPHVPGGTQRGIEKKDIRRGMVIAKPGSITPHSREAAPAETGMPEPDRGGAQEQIERKRPSRSISSNALPDR